MGARSGGGGGAGSGQRFQNYVSSQIKRGVSASAIADKMVSKGIDRASALFSIAMVGTKMNMKANPGMDAHTAFKAFTGIK